MICPECMGTLVASDGQNAQCTTHGGRFRILFSRSETFAPPAVAEGNPAAGFTLAPGALCIQHPNVPAVFACEACGAPVCATCAFPGSGGGQMCPQCVTRSVVAVPPPGVGVGEIKLLPAGVRCVQHPNIQAVQQCTSCGAFMCPTCDFALPGGIHVCPACAGAPRTALSSRRKMLLIGSFVLAIWSTVALGALLSGFFAQMGRTKGGEAALGLILTFVVLVPSIIGTALGFSAKDRRLANPPVVWIAVVWNTIILGGYLMLCVIGTFM